MKELSSIRSRLLTGMREYMDDGDVSYNDSHIQECAAILDRYATAISSAEGRAAGLACVREAVIALNALNVRAGEELIETDQREDICEFIIQAGAARGHFGAEEDVTEEWREW